MTVVDGAVMSLDVALSTIKIMPTLRIYCDKLEDYEYIQYRNGAYYYEDGAYLGKAEYEVVENIGMHLWAKDATWFVK